MSNTAKVKAEKVTYNSVRKAVSEKKKGNDSEFKKLVNLYNTNMIEVTEASLNMMLEAL